MRSTAGQVIGEVRSRSIIGEIFSRSGSGQVIGEVCSRSHCNENPIYVLLFWE
jgi:hypothetical protein